MFTLTPVRTSPGTVGRMTLEGCRGHLGNKMSFGEAQSLKSPNLSPFVPFCPLLSPGDILSPGDKIVPRGQNCPQGTKLSPGDKRGQKGTKGDKRGTKNMGTNLRDKSKGKINWKNVTYRYGRLTDIKKYIHIIMHSLIYARKKGINLIGGGGSSNFYHGGRLTFQSRQLFKKEHYQR